MYCYWEFAMRRTVGLAWRRNRAALGRKRDSGVERKRSNSHCKRDADGG